MSTAHRFGMVLFALSALSAGQPALNTAGIVVDAKGPVAGARVGWQGQSERVLTDEQGRFSLRDSTTTKRLIAAKPGYRIASAIAGDKPLTLRLERLPKDDNADYEWIDPHADPAKPDNCANCHAEIYREWQGSAHAKSATNPTFLSLFDGDNGKHKAWNAKAEHPDGSAVCATCHAPTMSSPNLDYDVREAKGVAKSGAHCDYCHKVADVPTDKLGLRFGRDGMFLSRPAKGDLLTFGPLDDAVRPGESFVHAPVYKESRYCASCHEGVVFGVHAYATYSEWLESPAKKAGKQCQDCHMAPTDRMTNAAPGKGGIERHAHTLASHHTPGGDADMLKKSLKLKVALKGRQVDIEVVAENVGHRVPTGFVDRHVTLVVRAFDAVEKEIGLVDGPRLPTSAGKWKDAPGMLYAKQLVGENQRAPLPFWLPVFKTDDTRLHPERPDRRTFVFAKEPERIAVQLWYRRFWQEVADSRGWRDNDVLVHELKLASRAP
ncbi:MAG: hypothetical protein HYR84_08460 [Planctomycetes bacterium]|nr:hypothetical protein [Planctomycetota bacterium]